MFSLRPTVLVLALALPGLCLAQSQGAGVTPEGKKGQIYKVQKGDTLWAISQTYLGTPWIWPSVWKENEAEISNPHRIYPGELIWISEGMIRKLTPEEAARLAAAAGGNGEATAAPAAPAPMQAQTGSRAPEESGPAPDPFESLDAAEVTSDVKVDVPTLQGVSFVTDEDLKASGAVMGNHDENYWTVQGQRTIVSLGEGQTHTGDAFTVFRVRREVRDPSTGERLGYFVQVLGKAEVTQVYPETSWARITESWVEIQPGDRIVPFVEEPAAITEVNIGEPVSGKIVALAPYRQRVGDQDYVILNQGSKGGLVPGRRLVAFRAGREVADPLTSNPLLVPDDVVGELFVVKASEKTSLALITRVERDMIVGDSFRAR
jgi:hypothetical protein